MTGFPNQIYQAAHCCSNQLKDEKSVNSYKADEAVELCSDMGGKIHKAIPPCVLLIFKKS